MTKGKITKKLKKKIVAVALAVTTAVSLVIPSVPAGATMTAGSITVNSKDIGTDNFGEHIEAQMITERTSTGSTGYGGMGHAFIEVSDGSKITVGYCMQSGRTTPSTSGETYNRVEMSGSGMSTINNQNSWYYGSDLITEADMVGALASGRYMYGGTNADPNSGSWNTNDGGTYGTYITTSGTVRGLMIEGTVYPLTEKEARVISGLLIHSVLDNTTVVGLSAKNSSNDLQGAYNHLLSIANSYSSSYTSIASARDNVDNNDAYKPHQELIWYVKNQASGQWEEYTKSTYNHSKRNDSTKYDVSTSINDELSLDYVNASGNIEFKVDYYSYGMCNKLVTNSNDTYKTVSGNTTGNGYLQFSDGNGNNVPYSVNIGGVTAGKISGTSRDTFSQSATLTVKASDLRKSNANFNVVASTGIGATATPFYNGNYAGSIYTPADNSGQDCYIISSSGTMQIGASLTADIIGYGKLELTKKSADPDMTVGNDCYDLSGAEYYLYDRTDNNRVVAKFVTEETEQGKSARGKVTEAYYNPANVNTYVVTDLPLDHLYQLKEIKAPVNGYEIDSKTYDITLSSDNVETPYPAEVSDKAGNDPLTLDIIKADYEALDDAGKAKADLSLENTQFTVKYYKTQYDSINQIPADVIPERTWVLKTKKTTDNGKTVYRALFTDEYKVSGDDFYYDSDDINKTTPVIPYGSITVEETKATLGYDEKDVVLTDETGTPVVNGIYFKKITDGGFDPSADWYITFNNKPTRSYLKFEKEDYETKKKLANVPFKITLIDTELDTQGNLKPVKDASGNYVRLESHIVVTDANGVYDSELLNNKTNTNANDNAKADNRGYYDGLSQSGIWFYGTAEEGHSEIYEDRGPFLYGMYLIEELRCSNNVGRQLVEPMVVKVNSESKLDLGTITNVPEPYISTVERDADTNSHYSVADDSVNLIDDVTYNYLTEGQKYTLWGILVDSSTRKPLLDKSGKMITATKSFTATGSVAESKQTANGTESMTFTFDGTGMDGKTFVVYEYLYKGENVTDYDFIKADGSLVTDKAGTKIHCLHTDVYSPEQTGYFPSVSTKAWDVRTKTNTLSADEIVEVADTVTLTNLMVGEKYELNATLINKETGEALKNDKGEVITGTYSFTADATNDSQNVFFPKFKRSLIEDGGADLVIFEELIWKKDNGDVVYAQHKDINDTKQTLKYINLETTATSNGDKVAPANETATIIDVVEYTNLIVGNEYELTGVLMVKSTNKPLLDKDGKEVSTTIKFKPEKANDKVEMVFTFDASLLQGESIVVFESLKDDGIEVATHNDISDDDQTVDFPSMGTSLVEKETGLPMGYLNENLTLVDTVSYEKFVVGKKYKITGILMNKDTGLPLMDSKTMKFITGETEFTPTTENGTVNVEFTFNAYDVGIVKEDNTVSDIVCFEEAYYTVKNSEGKEEEVVFAYHKDLTSVSQRVQIPSGRTTAKDSTTGTHTGTPEEKAKIVDTVYYTNLIPNKTYRLEGKLWTKDKDGNAIPFLDNGKEVVSSVEFTPIEATGSIEMVFEFNASSLKNSGTTITVFEDCYYEDTEILVFTHSDIEDKDQQIEYPKIWTEIKTEGGNKSLEPEKKYNLIDTITYEDLVVGETYVIEGVLMERVETRDTDGTVLSVSEKEYTNKDGNKSTAKVEFTPTEKDGKVDVSFEFYTSEDTYNKTFVCFERIYTKDTHTEVCDHTDINDAKQSFTVTDQVKTGDGPLGIIITLMCLALAGIIFMITNKKKDKDIPLIKL